MEIITENIDPNLEILEIYEKCQNFNLIHLFLAHCAANENFIYTTNFDSLIEIAFISDKSISKELKPVITYEDWSDLNLLTSSKARVFKLHGSLKI